MLLNIPTCFVVCHFIKQYVLSIYTRVVPQNKLTATTVW